MQHLSCFWNEIEKTFTFVQTVQVVNQYFVVLADNVTRLLCISFTKSNVDLQRHWYKYTWEAFDEWKLLYFALDSKKFQSIELTELKINRYHKIVWRRENLKQCLCTYHRVCAVSFRFARSIPWITHWGIVNNHGILVATWKKKIVYRNNVRIWYLSVHDSWNKTFNYLCRTTVYTRAVWKVSDLYMKIAALVNKS